MKQFCQIVGESKLRPLLTFSANVQTVQPVLSLDKVV